MGSLVFGYLAGVLSILSPCVIPLLPVILAAAAAENRYGSLSLALGLAISFTFVGTFIAAFGLALGIDGTLIRAIAGLLMVGVGFSLVSVRMQDRFIGLLSPLGAWFGNRSGRVSGAGLQGQFSVGLLLGLVWSPCVGPTLGAATLMASRGENLLQVSLVMALFGLGAATPLALLGSLSRDMVHRMRPRMLQAGRGGKKLMGLLMLAIGLLIAFGLDKRVEAHLVALSPVWLSALSARF